MNNQEQSGVNRFGYVSDYDPKRHMARVVFPDKDNLVSDWLPVVVHNSLKNHDEFHLDIGEHVFCSMLGNGIENGVIIGAVYNDSNKPLEGDINIRKVTFDDGTEIMYNRKEHELTINCKGNIEIKAVGNIKLSGSRIDLN